MPPFTCSIAVLSRDCIRRTVRVPSAETRIAPRRVRALPGVTVASAWSKFAPCLVVMVSYPALSRVTACEGYIQGSRISIVSLDDTNLSSQVVISIFPGRQYGYWLFRTT